MGRHLKIHLGELCCPCCESVGSYLHAREDKSAAVVLLAVNNRESCGGSHINDDEGDRVLVYSRNSVHSLIASQLCRVVDEDIESRLYSGTCHHYVNSEELADSLLDGIGHRGHYR